MFVTYRFVLLVRECFVSIGYPLTVACVFWCVLSLKRSWNGLPALECAYEKRKMWDVGDRQRGRATLMIRIRERTFNFVSMSSTLA